MSDFLLNLARRAAGVTPVVTARTGLSGDLEPPADALEPDPDGVESLEQRLEHSPSQPYQRIDSPVATPAAGQMVASPPSAPFSTASPTVIQRMALPIEVAPLAVSQSGPAFAPHVPIQSATREPKTAETAPTKLLLTAANEANHHESKTSQPAEIVPVTIEPRLEDRNSTSLVPAQRPAANADVAREAPARTLADPAARGVTSMESSLFPLPRPAPAPSAGSQLPMPSPIVEAGPERVVHVRIGAIEIHGAPQAPSVVPSMATAPSAAPSAPIGFDRFTRLRTYASWDR